MVHGHGAYVQTAEQSDTVGRHSGGTGRRAGRLLRDNVERPGGRARVGQARCHGKRRGASGRMGRYQTTNNLKGATIAQDDRDTRRYRPGAGTRWPGGPIFMLHRRRGALDRYERPCALCESLRTLCERGCVLAPLSPCAAWRGGACEFARSRRRPGAPRPSCCMLCATGAGCG